MKYYKIWFEGFYWEYYRKRNSHDDHYEFWYFKKEESWLGGYGWEKRINNMNPVEVSKLEVLVVLGPKAVSEG